MTTGLLVISAVFIIAFVVSHGVAIALCARSGSRAAMWAVIAAGCIVVAAAFAGIGAPQHARSPVFDRAVWAAAVMLIGWPASLVIIAASSIAAYFLCGRKANGRGRRAALSLSIGVSFALDAIYLFSQFTEMH